ncbi:MAG: hypothetical protein IT159_03860 [Bryobacterales bacterium]|nr:hypothetical protein [Bryobacterales bacterium]
MLRHASGEDYMFRPLTGYKAHFQGLTLMVVSEFDEWRVIVHTPEVVVQGARQFSPSKAKDHALCLARNYLSEVKQQAVEETAEPDWQPTGSQDWLVWKS